MAAPVVRELQSTIDQLRQASQPQYNLLQQDEAGLATSGAAQEAGLAAKKDTAFRDITASAQDRGALFSGFRPEEQARYTADTYLPALAGLQQAITASRRQIQGQRANLDTSNYDRALGFVEGDKSAFQQYQNQQEQMAAQQAEADRDRNFRAAQSEKEMSYKAQQDAIDRQFKAQQAAADRSVTRASNVEKSKGPTLSQATLGLFSGYNPTDQKFRGYTESVVIPNLMADFGLTKEQAAKAAYDTRKQLFNE